MTASRLAAVLGLLLGAGLALGPGCGSTPRCGPGLCSGCCDPSGQCRAGSDNSACGANGLACTTCGLGACSLGACIGGPGGTGGFGGSSGGGATAGGSTSGGAAGGTSGGAAGGMAGGASGGTAGGTAGGSAGGAACSNCNGCCQNGVCRGGNTSAACGFGGIVCRDCTAQSQACVNGACAVAPPSCGPSSCLTGCCRNNVCEPPSVSACGANGGACVTCGATQLCQQGQCRSGAAGGSAGGGPLGGGSAGGGPVGGGPPLPDGGGPCSLTCISGCCDASGQCRPGTTTTACGSLGALCQACSLSCIPNPLGGGLCL
jgi:hypothetical protein